MWLLTTRNRPEQCQQVLDACVETGVTSPGIVWMDGCDYPGLRMPEGWSKVTCLKHLNIGAIMRRFYQGFPNLNWYGWMADDCVPLSPGWDQKLIETAKPKYISYPNDNWQRGVKERDGSPHVTSIICMGGDLVRSMGFWVLPNQVQMFIDDVWESVAVPCNLMRYQPDVHCDHRHFANGKRPRDGTDTRLFNARNFPDDDREIYESWLSSQEYQVALNRARNLQP